MIDGTAGVGFIAACLLAIVAIWIVFRGMKGTR
jgi:hypothetical protein